NLALNHGRRTLPRQRRPGWIRRRRHDIEEHLRKLGVCPIVTRLAGRKQFMNARWTTLPNAERVLRHADDARPAWLWSGDGQRLIWANPAAGLFLAKLKKHGLKRAAPAVPIRGQVARIIRLGSKGRTSLARIQFLAGGKPTSATCATTPLAWENGETALLVVAVDPIAPEILAAARAETAEEPAPPAVDDDETYARELESWRMAEAERPDAAPMPPVPAEEAPGDVPAAAPERRLSEL